jgi:quercetin dioxygenase-like cupin family protein
MTEENNWTIVRSTTSPDEPDTGDSALRVFELSKGGVHKLERSCQVIRVIAGCAWITLNGQDIIVEHGDEIHLDPGEHSAIISNLCDELLVYKID